jgi:formate hydrogenlyase transcriptional activator
MSSGASGSSEAVTGRRAPDRIEFETLISDLSARLVAAPPEQVEPAIQGALEDVRTFFGADRCVLLNISADQAFAHVGLRAYAAGVPDLPTDLNLIALFPWARQRLLVDHLPASFRRISDLPPEAETDRASFEQYSPMRSHLAVPISGEPVVRNVVVIHWVRQECDFPDLYVPRLRVLGELMVNALRRKQAFVELRQSEERLDRAAAAAHCGLWELDLDTGAIWVTPETRAIFGVGPDEFTTYELLLRLTHETDREGLVTAIHSAISERLTLEHTFRIVRADGAVRWIHSTGRPGDAHVLLGASVDVTERQLAIEEILRLRERLERENLYLRQEAKRRLGTEQIIGRGRAIRQTLALAEQVASTDSTVLLLGETGSGKERFASYIHECSRRRDRPMIRVNCSAIPTALIESEMFGREKGAYTGALSKQLGRFELAHGSTLFLDEIGELPLEVQVKLLRVLESKNIERLGNPRPVPVDVRIITATNRDLARAVREGRFREDLYYRLNIFPITVPPLRDRREDIPLFVQAFVDELAATMGKRIEEIDPPSLAALAEHTWPGNVRELRNVVERAMILASGPILRIPAPQVDLAEMDHRSEVATADRDEILRVLGETGWRIRGVHGAAARLGLKPTTLESRIKKLGLTRPGTASPLP